MMASLGATVIAMSRTKEDLDELKKQIPNCEPIVVDVADGILFFFCATEHQR
jgi:short-subunit dehydrogenase involved in D-alanine esterification of teichoic acids